MHSTNRNPFTKSQITKFNASRAECAATAAMYSRVFACCACLAFCATLERGELPESINPLY